MSPSAWTRVLIVVAALGTLLTGLLGARLRGVERPSDCPCRCAEIDPSTTADESADLTLAATPRGARVYPARADAEAALTSDLAGRSAHTEGSSDLTVIMSAGPIKEGGTALRDMPVQLTALDRAPHGADEDARRTTDAEGQARWQGLPSGRYRLESPTLGYRFVELDAATTPERVLEWVVTDMVLVEGVVSERAGRPVGSAEIWLSQYQSSAQGEVVARADADGYFRFAIALEAERWISALAPGFELALPARIHPNDHHQARGLVVNLTLDRGGERVQGRVVGAQGRGIPNARVELFGGSAARSRDVDGPLQTYQCPRFIARSDSDGVFTFEGLPPVGFWIDVRATGYGGTLYNGNSGRWREREIVVELAREARLVGRVIDEDGQPVDEGKVNLGGGPGGAGVHSVTLDPTGRFALDGLPAGSHPVRIWRRGWSPTERTVELVPGGEVNLGEIVMSRLGGVRVTGRVTPAESPLGGPWTLAIDSSAGRRLTHSVAGRFEFEPLDGAEATLTVAYTGDLALYAKREWIRLDAAEDDHCDLTIDVAATGRTVTGFIHAQGLESSERFEARFFCAGLSTFLSARSALGDGRFQVVLPGVGEWSLEVVSASGEVLHAQDLEGLAAGGADLGVIELGRAGSLVLSGGAAAGGAATTLKIWRASGALVRTAEVASALTMALRPGKYELELEGALARTTRHSFEIRPGAATEIDLAACLAAPVAVRVLLGAGWPEGSWALIHTPRQVARLAHLEGRAAVELTGAAGEYRVVCGLGLERRLDQRVWFDGVQTQVIGCAFVR